MKDKIIAYVEIWNKKYSRGWVMRAQGKWAPEMLQVLGPELSEWPIPGVPWESHIIAVWEGTYTSEAVGEWRAPTTDELLTLTFQE